MIIARLLKNFGLKVAELHANMKQKQRLKELCRFRGGQANILVATDLASRGLDIPQVEFVINFDIPRSGFEYIHRIGRCGRIDRCGTAITFVSQFDIFLLQKIEQHIKSKMKEYKVKKYEKMVMERMKKVLIVRAGIINGIETKYLIDPHAFKRDATLRWNGKFTDPRILGKINLKNEDGQANGHHNRNLKRRRQRNSNPQKTIDQNQELYQDFRTAFDNEYIEKNVEEKEKEEKQELDEQKQREIAFKRDLGRKEKEHGTGKWNNEMDIDKQLEKDMEMEVEDGNMNVIEEEVRLNNEDAIKTRKESEMEKIGKDYHSLPGWNSFRTGKDGKRLQRVERRERAQKFQLKRKSMELKRSKREGRKSELDLFSIYQKEAPAQKTKQNANEQDDKFNRNGPKKSSKGNRRKKAWRIRKKKKKAKEKLEATVKISKSLKKKLSTEEREKFVDKKRSWFGGDDSKIEWV